MKGSKLKRSIAAVMAAAAMCFSAIPAQFGIIAGAADDSHTVTVTTDGNGSASTDPTVQVPNGQVTLTATPNSGYEFDHWEIASQGDSSYSKTASVVFILDTTASMSSEIAKVKNNLINLVQSLDAKGIGLNISIIEYSDARHYDGSTKYDIFANGTNWTTDVNEAVTIFDGIKTGSGWDETPTDAFTQLVAGDGSLNFPADSINNYIFLLTDEGYYDFADNAENNAKNRYSMETWIDKFIAAGVKVSVVTTEREKTTYESLYLKTGGLYINIKADDYGKLMEDFSDYLDQTAVSVNKTSYENPYTMEMPKSDVTAKAFFKPVSKSAYTITVVTDGHGEAYASRSTAYAGEVIGITAKPASGYVLDTIECVKGGAVLNGSTFVMPESDVVISVSFKENLSEYISASRPYSYIFSYDSGMNLIETNCNRDFDNYPEYVTVKINLGKKYAGRTGKICAGRKSGSNVIENITLDENGCYVFKAGIAKNYSFVLED